MPPFLRYFLEHRFFWFFIAALLLILRFQTFLHEIYNGDEANFATHAMVILDGGWPYVDTVEKKPPLIYLFYTLFFWIFGNDVRAVHFGVTLCILVASFFSYLTLKLFFEEQYSRIAAIFFVLYTSSFIETEIFAANCEILMLTPLVISFYFLFLGFKTKNKKGSFFISGFFTGLAFLFKHQAGIQIIAILFLFIFSFRKNLKQLFSSFFVYFSGFIFPISVTILVYYYSGYLKELYEWNILSNFFYVKSPVPLSYSLEKGFLNTLGFFISTIFPVYLFVIILKNWIKLTPDIRPLVVFCLASFFLSLIPVGMGGRFYGHYYLQLYPSLLLLSAVSFILYSSESGKLFLFRKLLFFGFFCVPLFFQCFSFYRTSAQVFDGAKSYHLKLAQEIEKNTLPTDTIFVWGNYSHAYYFAQRRPASRFILCEYVLPYWEKYYQKKPDFVFESDNLKYLKNFFLMMSELKEKKPALILDTSTSSHFEHFSLFKIESFPPLFDWIRSEYQVVSVIEGVTIYQKK